MAGTSAKQYVGSTNSDNQRATASTAPAYFYLVPTTDSRYDYDYSFRRKPIIRGSYV